MNGQYQQMFAAYDEARRVTGFYQRAIHGDDIPKQALEITSEQYVEALAQRSQGQEVYLAESMDKLEYRKPVEAEEQKWTMIRAQRDFLLNEMSWLVERHREQLDLGVETTLSEARYKALLKYRQALRDLPASETDPEAIKWPKPPAFVKDLIKPFNRE